MSAPRTAAGLSPRPLCPYCSKPARLVHADVIYPGRGFDGLYWFCKDCDAWVGTHKNSPRATPLGSLAKVELRALRLRLHDRFDRLWRAERGRAMFERGNAYAWLAGELKMPVKRCHIGFFNETQCRVSLRLVEQLLARVPVIP